MSFISYNIHVKGEPSTFYQVNDFHFLLDLFKEKGIGLEKSFNHETLKISPKQVAHLANVANDIPPEHIQGTQNKQCFEKFRKTLRHAARKKHSILCVLDL